MISLKEGDRVKRYPTYNDYELIEMIQSGDDFALSLMVDKYKRFIAKKIHKFNLAYEFDDLYQEGLLILYKSVMVFNPDFNKTFTRFFETNYERFLMSTIKTFKTRTHAQITHYKEIKENNHAIRECSVYYDIHLKEIKAILTPLEYRVYILRETKNYSIKAIAAMLAIKIKTVYNSLHRAKAKIQAYFRE